MQWRREKTVEFIQVPHGQQAFPVKQAGMLRQFGQRLWLHGVEKHTGVDKTVEPLSDGVAARSEVDGRADRSNCVDD